MTPELRYGPNWLHDKIAAGGLVVIDGAMGTELETRGVPMNEKVWSGVAMLSHPEVVRAAHADYIAAGAEVIITNTFGAGPQALESAGFGDQMESITRSAVEVARQARDEAAKGPVAIAGSMCPWVDPKESLDVVHLSEGFRKQAELLAEEDVDLIALEMCSSRLDYAALITEAAVATGLPVWLGMSCARHEETGDLVGFDQPHVDFAESVSELACIGVGVINIMHTSIADTAAGLELVKEHWSGPIGAYPESGHFVMPNWQFVDIIEPDDLVQEMRVWVANGVQIIGGCCGLGLPHIRALKAAFA
jgi:homocysteine S-methyltransferase